MSSTYLIALGSSRRHHFYGSPTQVVRAAMEELSALGTVLARSGVIPTDPVGPAQRRFANAAVTLASEYDPESLLSALKRMEREFGRRSAQQWSDRVLDLDIILWDGGFWSSKALQIPHSLFRERSFVLAPAKEIAPDWRDPISRLSIKQLFGRLTRNRPVTRWALRKRA